MNSYRDLIVWQKGVDLVVEVYKVTESFPKNEIYGLTSQIRRAAISIPANVCEGYSRKHRKEYAQFIKTAFASGAELETHLIIANRLALTSPKQCERANSLLSEVMKMLNKLSQKLAN